METIDVKLHRVRDFNDVNFEIFVLYFHVNDEKFITEKFYILILEMETIDVKLHRVRDFNDLSISKFLFYIFNLTVKNL